MAQTIKLKRSSVEGRAPTTSDLELGEIAINTFDGKVYIKKNDGTESIVEVGQLATFTPSGNDGELQYNDGGVAGAASFTFIDDANNRLGLGTDTPSTTLEVSGTVTATTFDGSLDWSNVANKPDPTLTLNGDVSGSATFTDLGDATLTVTIANDSHTHDGRYYTETESDARFVNVAGDTLTGFLTLHADPTSAFHAATKEYVDTVAAASLHYHTPVRLESPTALNAAYNNGTNGVGATLTNSGTNEALTIDGVAVNLNDRVLVYQQSNAAHNGVYTVTTVGDGSTPWVLTRATDADSYAPSDPDSFGQGDAFFVQEGNTGAGELYVMNTEGAITFGTTGINFVQISSAQIYSAGSGLTLSGTQFAHEDTSSQASVNNSGGTVIQDITLDTFGHITGLASVNLDDRYFTETEADTRYVNVTGDTMTGNLSFGDNNKAIFGAGSDLQIYHDGSNSYVQDLGAGNLLLKGTNLALQSSTGTLLYGYDGGAVILYHNNAQKLATTATGIDVTGTVTADGLTVDGIGVITHSGTMGGGLTLSNRAFEITNNTTSLYFDTNEIFTDSNNFHVGAKNANGTIYFQTGSSVLNRMQIANNGDISFYEDTGTTPKFFWDASAESLGIGTSSPTETLHIVPEATDPANNDHSLRYGVRADNGYAPGYAASGLSILGQAQNTSGDLHTTYVQLSARAPSLNGSHGVTSFITLTAPGTQNAYGTGQIDFYIRNDSKYTFPNDPSITSTYWMPSLMTIKSNGNVGIGTTSPEDPLHVAGDIRTDNAAYIVQETSTGGAVRMLGINSSNIAYVGPIDGGPTSTIFNASSTSNTSAFYTAGTEAMRIDSSGNLLVGHTSANFNSVGHGLLSAGNAYHTRDGGASLTLNRKTSDGSIAEFRKDNNVIGSVGTVDGDLNVYPAAVGHKGLRFGNGYIGPTSNSTAVEDGSTDLGLSTVRFKDLYLSGSVILGASDVTLTSNTATLATTTQTEIASFSATSYGGGKFVITAKDGSNRHIVELLVTHDGTTAVATQYGSIYTSAELATYDVDISGGNVRILATSASTNSTVYKVAETLMEA